MTTKFVEQLIVENGLLTGCTAAQVGSDAMTPSGVTAGVYGDSTHTLTATVDAAGRVTALSTNAIAAGGSGTVTSVATTAPITGGPISTTGTIGHATSGATAGSYTNANITVDEFGHVTAVANGTSGTVTGVTATAPVQSSGGSTPNISLANSGVTAGSFTNASVTVDALGRVTAVNSGTAPVTNVTGTAPIVSSGGATPAISLAASGVTAGSYANANITVDEYGRVTTAGNGSASGTVTSVGLSVPSEFAVTGSPVTGSGTIAVTKTNQSANLVYAGPSSGSAAAPSFRAMTVADLPGITTLANGALLYGTGGSNLSAVAPSLSAYVLTGSVTGVPSFQPPATAFSSTISLTTSGGYNITSTWSTVGNLSFSVPYTGTYLLLANVRSYLYASVAMHLFLRFQDTTVGTTLAQIISASLYGGSTTYWQGANPLLAVVSLTAVHTIALQAYNDASGGTCQIVSDSNGQPTLSYVRLS